MKGIGIGVKTFNSATATNDQSQDLGMNAWVRTCMKAFFDHLSYNLCYVYGEY